MSKPFKCDHGCCILTTKTFSKPKCFMELTIVIVYWRAIFETCIASAYTKLDKLQNLTSVWWLKVGVLPLKMKNLALRNALRLSTNLSSTATRHRGAASHFCNINLTQRSACTSAKALGISPRELEEAVTLSFPGHYHLHHTRKKKTLEARCLLYQNLISCSL